MTSFDNSGNASANSVDSISTPDLAYTSAVSAAFMALMTAIMLRIHLQILTVHVKEELYTAKCFIVMFLVMCIKASITCKQ